MYTQTLHTAQKTVGITNLNNILPSALNEVFTSYHFLDLPDEYDIFGIRYILSEGRCIKCVMIADVLHANAEQI